MILGGCLKDVLVQDLEIPRGHGLSMGLSHPRALILLSNIRNLVRARFRHSIIQEILRLMSF